MKTTFNSPFGRYRFLRLPFGLNLSQDVFQERMDLILEQCPGTISTTYDLGVFGRTEEEHNANLHQLMRAAQKHGLIFNGDKCKIKTRKLHLFGLVFDANGVHPDPARIDDIRRMTKPADADVVFGCERFHTYVYGTRFIVDSDQMPLEMITLENLAAAPLRLQRMLLHIQPYDVQICYWPGKEMAQ